MSSYILCGMVKSDKEWFSRASLERLQLEQIGIGQLHWSTANYAPPQELALWDGLVAMYEKVYHSLLLMIEIILFQLNKSEFKFIQKGKGKEGKRKKKE